jgi:chromosome segregation ATPase
MSENINLDVAGVLTVVSNLRDKNPTAAERTLDVLRLILNRDLYVPSDVHAALKPLSEKLDALLAQQSNDRTQFQQALEDLSMSVKDVKDKAAQNTAALQKVSAEQRQILDKLTEAQGNIDAKVAEAVAAARAQDREALEAALADVQSEQAKQSDLLAEMDARVADAPAPDNGGGNTEPAPTEPSV